MVIGDSLRALREGNNLSSIETRGGASQEQVVEVIQIWARLCPRTIFSWPFGR